MLQIEDIAVIYRGVWYNKGVRDKNLTNLENLINFSAMDSKKLDEFFPRTPHKRFGSLTFEEIDMMCGFFRKVQMLFPDKPMIKKMTSWYITLLINDLGEEEQKEIRDKLRAVK